jgi:crotonobetainyl-CoA:carnitine CoA-transferase CaiB-like acyl-CoA transferase
MSLPPTVLEIGTSVAAGYCGRLLAMMGFDVVQLEDPVSSCRPFGGPSVTTAAGGTANALAEYLGCFKESAVVAGDSGLADRARQFLYARADIVIDDHEGDPAPILERDRWLRGLNRRMVHVVLSPFGLTGPYAAYRGNEFIDLAMSGHLLITGDPDREPLQAGGPWSGYVAGTIAAIAGLAAAHRADQTGEGRLIDIGRMEAMASVHQWTLVQYTHQGYVKRRLGNRMGESLYPYSFYRCSDGWVCIGTASALQWEGFCLALDVPELLIEDRFATSGDRFDRADELDEIVVPRMERLTMAETVARMQRHRVPAGPVLNSVETLLDEHLDERGFWAPLNHIGPRARVPARAFHLVGEPPFRPAPRRGENTEAVLHRWGVPASDIADLSDQQVRPESQHVP